MKSLAPALLLFAAWTFVGAVPGQAQSPGWKLSGSENLPMPGNGVRHQVQTVTLEGATGATATLHFVGFDAAEYSFALFDQGEPGRNSLGETMAKNRCLAGTNGGYFQPDFEPVGLLLAGGKLIKRPAHSRLLSGALVVTGHRIALKRSFEPLPGKNARQAVQAGPFLVEFGRLVPGLNAVRSARRTAVFTDGKRGWGLVVSSALTLEEFGQVLADPALAPAGFRIDKALNLDGGSSTGLWAQQPGQAPFYQREIGIVRDFVGVVPRSPEGSKSR